MKSRNLGFMLFAALFLQAAGMQQADVQHRPACSKATAIVTTNTTTNTIERYFVGNEALPIQMESQNTAVRSLSQLRESTPSLPEGTQFCVRS